MTLRWSAAFHLPYTAHRAFWTRDTAPTLLFQLPSPRPLTFSFALSRPTAGHPGLPLLPSFPSPSQFPNLPTSFLPPEINGFSSPPLRPLFSGPGLPALAPR